MEIGDELRDLLPQLQELERSLSYQEKWEEEEKEGSKGELRRRIWDVIKKLDRSFGNTGSIFRLEKIFHFLANKLSGRNNISIYFVMPKNVCWKVFPPENHNYFC